MTEKDYLWQENWYGSYYELCLELGPTGDDQKVVTALRTLWQNQWLTGPWQELTDFGHPVDPGKLQISTALYGIAKLPADQEVGCVSHVVRVEGEFDWLDFSIPTGMLELSFRVDYPLHYATNPWLEELDDFLADLGRGIYETASFRLGIIGEEVSGLSSSEKLTNADCEQGGFLIPRPLWDALSPRCGHRDLSVDLMHVPYKGAHMEFGS